jgi:hypothetical protein
MENGKWKMENGKWKMENGKWKMENGKLTMNTCTGIVMVDEIPAQEATMVLDVAMVDIKPGRTQHLKRHFSRHRRSLRHTTKNGNVCSIIFMIHFPLSNIMSQSHYHPRSHHRWLANDTGYK